METPLVTIIIPIFNSEEFLTETLDSLLDQTYKNWQCLMVDDGSWDQSLEIMKSYCKQDKRFRRIQREREPKGVSVCRNIGINVSEGKYIIFLDSDDLFSKSCLANRVDYMERNLELDFAVFQMEAFGLKSFILTKKEENYLDAFLTFDFPWVVTSPMWNAGFLKNGIRFNEKLKNLEDPELHIRVLKSEPNFKVLYDSEPDCYYRQHRVYRKEKSAAYTNFLEGYALFFNNYEFFEGFSQAQRKLMRYGFFRMVLNIIPPFSDFENDLFRQTAKDLNELNVTGFFHFLTNKWWMWILNRVSKQNLEQIIVYSWTLTISPRNFVRDLIIPKLKRKFDS